MRKNAAGVICRPQKIWVGQPRMLRTITPTGAYFQTRITMTKAEIELATNIINGKCTPPQQLENEQIGQVAGGFGRRRAGVDSRLVQTSLEARENRSSMNLTRVGWPARGAAAGTPLPAGRGSCWADKRASSHVDRPAGLVHRVSRQHWPPTSPSHAAGLHP